MTWHVSLLCRVLNLGSGVKFLIYSWFGERTRGLIYGRKMIGGGLRPTQKKQTWHTHRTLLLASQAPRGRPLSS